MKRILSLLIVVCVALSFMTGCTDDNQERKANVTTTRFSILHGTVNQTEAIKYETDKQGPNVVIVGGIHGDELAGWNTALELEQLLPEREDIKGNILLIPRANILGCERNQRYPQANASLPALDTTYTDLNRAFPGSTTGTATQKIAAAITNAVEEFEADYIIDLHESLRSWASGAGGRLGDMLIFNSVSSSLFVMDLIDYYNEKYAEEGDVPFKHDTNPPSGSYNEYFSQTTSAVVFTVETSRELALEKRISQQHNILNSLFENIW